MPNFKCTVNANQVFHAYIRMYSEVFKLVKFLQPISKLILGTPYAFAYEKLTSTGSLKESVKV